MATWRIVLEDGGDTPLCGRGPWGLDALGRPAQHDVAATFRREGEHLVVVPRDTTRLLRGAAPPRWLHAPTRLVDDDRLELGTPPRVLRIRQGGRPGPPPPPRRTALRPASATGRALVRQIVLQTGALSVLGRARGWMGALRGGPARPALWIAALVSAGLTGRCTAGSGTDAHRLARAEARAAGCPAATEPSSWAALTARIVEDDVALLLRGEVLRAFMTHLPRAVAEARTADPRVRAALEATGVDAATAQLLSVVTAGTHHEGITLAARPDPQGLAVCVRGPLALSGAQARHLGLRPTDDALVDAATIAAWSRLAPAARREAVLTAWTVSSQQAPAPLARAPRRITLPDGAGSCIVRDHADERDGIGRVAVAIAAALRHASLPRADEPGAASARVAALHLLHEGPLGHAPVHEQLASATPATRATLGRHLATIAASSCLSPSGSTTDACDILRGRVSRGMPP